MKLTYEQAALLLCRLPKIGPRTAKKLIDHLSDPQEAFSSRLHILEKINGLGESHRIALAQWKAALPFLEEVDAKQQLMDGLWTKWLCVDPPPVFSKKEQSIGTTLEC